MSPSTTLELIVRHILSRFIKNEVVKNEEIESIKDALDLPVLALKEVEANDGAAFKKLYNVDTIRDLAKLNPVDPFEGLVSDKITDPEEYEQARQRVVQTAQHEFTEGFEIKRFIMVARMISRAWKKRKSYTKQKGEDTKVIVLGLDNAGKTAILSGLGGRLGIKDLKKLKPTKRVDRQKISTKKLNIHIWDFGGQNEYREDYLKNPEKYFLRTDLIIYVIDLQDPDRYNKSFDYFTRILDILSYFGESPFCLVFLHKADPDVVEDPDFQLNLEYAKGRVVDIMREYSLDYDVYLTSIFNFFTSEPKFSRYIKDVLSDQTSLVDPTKARIEGLGDVLDSTLNLVIQLANSVNEQIGKMGETVKQVETRLARLEAQAAQPKPAAEAGGPATLQKPAVPPAARPGSPPPTTTAQTGTRAPPQERRQSVRFTVLSELKALLRKRGQLARDE